MELVGGSFYQLLPSKKKNMLDIHVSSFRYSTIMYMIVIFRELSQNYSRKVVVRRVFRTTPHNGARAHMALGARVALRRPAQNRLKIGVRREGTVEQHTRKPGVYLARTAEIQRRSVWSRVMRPYRNPKNPITSTCLILQQPSQKPRPR